MLPTSVLAGMILSNLEIVPCVQVLLFYCWIRNFILRVKIYEKTRRLWMKGNWVKGIATLEGKEKCTNCVQNISRMLFDKLCTCFKQYQPLSHTWLMSRCIFQNLSYLHAKFICIWHSPLSYMRLLRVMVV
jgi:hypothetical protein